MGRLATLARSRAIKPATCSMRLDRTDACAPLNFLTGCGLEFHLGGILAPARRNEQVLSDRIWAVA